MQTWDPLFPLVPVFPFAPFGPGDPCEILNRDVWSINLTCSHTILAFEQLANHNQFIAAADSDCSAQRWRCSCRCASSLWQTTARSSHGELVGRENSVCRRLHLIELMWPARQSNSWTETNAVIRPKNFSIKKTVSPRLPTSHSLSDSTVKMRNWPFGKKMLNMNISSAKFLDFLSPKSLDLSLVSLLPFVKRLRSSINEFHTI